MSALITEAAAPSLAVATAEQRAALAQQTARETAWYADYDRFMTDADIYKAAPEPGRHIGRLAFVAVDENVAPTARLRNPLNEKYPSFLLPEAFVVHKAIGRMWRKRVLEHGVEDDRIRLAATSLVRSQANQDILVADPRKLASPDSTHCVGVAEDYDQAGYYWFSPDGRLLKVPHPERSVRQAVEIGEELGSDPDKYVPPTDIAPVPFDHRVNDALAELLDELHKEERINTILEFPWTINQCSHVAPNPEVSADEWNQLAA